MDNKGPNGLNLPRDSPNRSKEKNESDSSPKKNLKRHVLNLSDFECGNFIADGTMSTVVEARTLKHTTAREKLPDKNVVLKCIPKYRVTQRMRNFLRREIEIHLLVGSHPNISTLYASFEDDQGIYLVLEKIRGPTLHELIRKNGKLPEKFALQVTDQIVEGVSFLHSRGYAHRDLSSKNIMFREWPSLESGKLHVMLIDMGDASFRDLEAVGGERCSSEKVGTLLFTAPEVHKDPTYLPESCDMWSIGVLIYLMISGKYPYKAETNEKMVQIVQQRKPVLDGEVWDGVTQKTKDIIRDLLLPMPAMRPDVESMRTRIEAALKGKVKKERGTGMPAAERVCGELKFDKK